MSQELTKIRHLEQSLQKLEARVRFLESVRLPYQKGEEKILAKRLPDTPIGFLMDGREFGM